MNTALVTVTDLVRTSWFGFGDSGTDRVLSFAETWSPAFRKP